MYHSLWAIFSGLTRAIIVLIDSGKKFKVDLDSVSLGICKVFYPLC